MGFLRAVRVLRCPETEVPDLPVAGAVFGSSPVSPYILCSPHLSLPPSAPDGLFRGRSRLPVRMTAFEVEICWRESRYVEACGCPDLIFRKHAPRLSVGRGADPKPAGASRSFSAGNKSWGIIGSGNRIRFLKKRRPDEHCPDAVRYGRGGRYSVFRTATVSAVRGTFGSESTLSDSAIVLSIRWMLW